MAVYEAVVSKIQFTNRVFRLNSKNIHAYLPEAQKEYSLYFNEYFQNNISFFKNKFT